MSSRGCHRGDSSIESSYDEWVCDYGEGWGYPYSILAFLFIIGLVVAAVGLDAGNSLVGDAGVIILVSAIVIAAFIRLRDHHPEGTLAW